MNLKLFYGFGLGVIKMNNEIKIKKFLRTQLEWYIDEKITEENFLYKIADCRESYPDFDYELELGLICMELRVKLLSLKMEIN